MSKRLIFVFCVVGMLALLCARLMFDGKPLSSTDKPALAHVAGTQLQTDIPPAKRESTMHLESVPNDSPPQKMKDVLLAGGRQWKLSFADQSLPIKVRERIGYDLNLVLGHLPRFEVDKLPFPIETSGRQLDRRVRFEGEGRKWNKALQADAFGCLFSGSSVDELYVPDTVVEAYTKAIELEQQNQAAYQQLDQFLARMSEIKEKPVENVRGLFVVADDFKSAEADLATIPAEGFAEGWGGKRYREASILDVAQTAGTPLEKYGSLVATTYAMSEGKVDDLPPLLFSNGQWRFLLQRPPT
jgi:hypothetical protein